MPSTAENAPIRDYLTNAPPAVRRALQRASASVHAVFDDGAHALVEEQLAAKAEAETARRRGQRRQQKKAQDRENETRRQLTAANKAPDAARWFRDEHERHVWTLFEAVTEHEDSAVILAARQLVAFVKVGTQIGRVRAVGGHATPPIVRMPRPPKDASADVLASLIRAALGKRISQDTLQDIVAEYLTRRARGDVRPLEQLAILCAYTCRERAREDASKFADSHDFSADESADLPHLSLCY